MNCPKCSKRMKKYLWGFTYYHICEDCNYLVLTSETDE